MIDILDAVRRTALAVGAKGWLDRLPSLVADLADEWSLRLGRVYRDGTAALVLDAVATFGDDERPVVLKVPVPRDDVADREITVLTLADGQGCVPLLRHDRRRGALLMPRLGPSMADLDLPVARRHELLSDAARRVWRPVAVPLPGSVSGGGAALPTGADKARQLADFIVSSWEALGRPCAVRVIDHALECAARRGAAHDAARAVLVHGDVHQWNALRDGDRFTLVDPDGLLAEPEYDFGILMREDPLELLTGDPTARARTLADRTGLDPAAVWEWGVAERVSTALVLSSIDRRPAADQMLATAEHVARHRRSVSW